MEYLYYSIILPCIFNLYTLEAKLIKKCQQVISYSDMYPIIKISKLLTKRKNYYIYFGLILLKDIYVGILTIIYFNIIRQFNIYIKNLVKQDRPYNMFPDEICYYTKKKNTLSFPSQSIQSWVIVYNIIYYYYPYYYVKLYSILCLSILGFTRIYRGLHYPHDIIISYLFASYISKYYLWFITNWK
jgi:hypothetical protein